MTHNYRPAQGDEVRCWKCKHGSIDRGFVEWICCANRSALCDPYYTCDKAERRTNA